jgi:glycogen synthase
MQLTGRGDGWTRRGEMRALSRLSDGMMRRATPSDVDGWVHFVGMSGPVSRTRYVTVFEMSPKQLIGSGMEWAASFGYRHATAKQMAWVARRQLALYQSAYACCVASRWAADSLVRDHGIDARKIRVIGYGRNADIPPPADRDWSTPRFLFVGRDWKRKNGDAVVRAFATLRNEVPAARLDVVGRHPPIDVPGVTGHGLIAVSEPDGRAKLETLFAEATCFVVPSFVEPFGIVYVEAAAAGLPSIAGSVGGTVDSVGDGGILVDAHDDDSIYRALREMADPDNARRLGALAFARSARLSWPATGQRVLRSLDLGAIDGVTLADYL